MASEAEVVDLWDDKDDNELAEIDIDQARMDAEKEEWKLSLLKPSSDTERQPIHKYKPGYLWVSDLTSQSWCEQQLLYGLMHPGPKVDTPAMSAGSSLHLIRELAVHDTITIKVTSSEDIWAIKMINLYGAINGFLEGISLRREIPIFGAPFNKDVFIVGLIDEIRCDQSNFSFHLLELKTRSSSRSLPSAAQQETHRLQVMLYKKLYDDLVKGKITKAVVAKHLNLNLKADFGEDVLKELEGGDLNHCKNLDSLLQAVFDKMQSVPCIEECLIEYCSQTDHSTMDIKSVTYDEHWLESKFCDCISFWLGTRDVRGVDIEEAWKCQRCVYAEDCDWRKTKAEHYSKINIQKCSPKKKL